MAIDLDLAARLKFARANAGYESAAEAADAMDIKEPTYQAHENGTRGITRKNLVRYAKFFHVNLDWLADNKGPVKGRAKDLLEGLPPIAVEEVLTFIEFLRTKHGV